MKNIDKNSKKTKKWYAIVKNCRDDGNCISPGDFRSAGLNRLAAGRPGIIV